MTFRVDNFRTAMQWDGARPNLFEVLLTFPNYVELKPQAENLCRFFCKASQLPSSTMGIVDVPYFGRQVKVAGNRTFPEWTVTVLNDEDFTLRNAFERWHRGMNDNIENTRDIRALSTSPLTPGASYAVDMNVYQYGKLGGLFPLKQYRFAGVFPIEISAIDLDWGNNDTIEEYTVTFACQYWTTVDQQASNPILSTAL